MDFLTKILFLEKENVFIERLSGQWGWELLMHMLTLCPFRNIPTSLPNSARMLKRLLEMLNISKKKTKQNYKT